MHAYSLDHDCKYYNFHCNVLFAFIRFLNYQKEYFFFAKLSSQSYLINKLCGCLRKFQPFYLPSF